MMSFLGMNRSCAKASLGPGPALILTNAAYRVELNSYPKFTTCSGCLTLLMAGPFWQGGNDVVDKMPHKHFVHFVWISSPITYCASGAGYAI